MGGNLVRSDAFISLAWWGGGGHQLDASQCINAVALAEKKGNCKQALALQEGA